MRAKRSMPDISFATVYNCLDTLVHCGLIRQVNLDRSPSRYCPNMGEHCHFYCDSCERVLDIDLPASGHATEVPVPKGFQVSRYEISLRGFCPDCRARKKNGKSETSA